MNNGENAMKPVERTLLSWQYKKEIDFAAIKRTEKPYIQVSSTIDAPGTFKCEI